MMEWCSQCNAVTRFLDEVGNVWSKMAWTYPYNDSLQIMFVILIFILTILYCVIREVLMRAYTLENESMQMMAWDYTCT